MIRAARSPLRGPHAGVQRRRGAAARRTPLFDISGSNPRCDAVVVSCAEAIVVWIPIGGEGGMIRAARSPLRGRHAGVQRRRGAAARRTPLFDISGSNPRCDAVVVSCAEAIVVWIPIGGEGGIRTLDGLLTHTPLAGARLRPLGHLSGRALCPSAERRMIPVVGSQRKAEYGAGAKSAARRGRSL